MMWHRDYFNFSVEYPVNDTERKVREEIATSAVRIMRPPIRSFAHPFDASVYLLGKGLCYHEAPLGVP